MPTGAVPLLEAINWSTSPLKAGVTQTIIRESAPMEQLTWRPFKGEALKHREETDLPAGQFRQVGGTYTRSYGTDTPHYWGVAIYGSEVFVDNYEVNVLGDEVPVKTRQFMKHGKSAALTMDKYIIDGTGTANDFMGINALADEGFGQVQSAGTNGAALSLDMLDEAKDSMRGQFDVTAIWANRTIRRKVTNLGRNFTNGYSMIDVGNDAFGRQVTMYDGDPIRIIGDDAEGNLILDFDETQGSSNVTTSLYYVGIAEDGLTGILGAGGHFEVMDFGETESAPGHLGRIEFYPGLACFNRYAVVRLKGLLAA